MSFCNIQLTLAAVRSELNWFYKVINVKMPTSVDILTFISMINTTSESLKVRKNLCVEISCSAELTMIFFYKLGPAQRVYICNCTYRIVVPASLCKCTD